MIVGENKGQRFSVLLYAKAIAYLIYPRFQSLLASPCSLGGRFDCYFGANPEDRFSLDETHYTRDAYHVIGKPVISTVKPV